MSQPKAGRGAPGGCARAESLECRTLMSTGTLDPTFGNGGVVQGASSIFAGGQAHAVALQADGRIIAAGGNNNDGILDYRLAPVTSQFALARFNSDGTLDPTFGTGGRVTASFGQVLGTIQALVIQPDGKIIAAGFTGPDKTHTHFAVLRFNSDGSPDTTFGAGGITITPFTTTDDATSLALQPDGRIVAAGSATLPDGTSEFALARYLPSGTLDPSFGTGGTVASTFGSNPNFGASSGANAVVVLKNGRIVAGGELNGTLTLAGLTPSGSLDPHFGKVGLASVALPNYDECIVTGLGVDRDGNIVAAGNAPSQQELIVTRFSSAGHLDRTFASRGLFITTFRDSTIDPGDAALNRNGQANAVAVQRDGKIVVVGWLQPGAGDISAGARIAAARLTPAGKLDPTFGRGGKVTTNTNQTIGELVVEAEAVVVQPDGRIVAAGTALDYQTLNAPGDSSDFMLLRYTRFGNLDRTFSAGIVGPLTVSFTGDAGALAQQGDGKLVVAGGNPWSLTRFLPDGTLDPSFGLGGHVLPPNDTIVDPNFGSYETPTAMSILPNGMILTGGMTSFANGPGLLKLAEYNPNGSVATHFGRHGIVTLALDKHAQDANTSLTAMEVQPDGKIVVGATDVVDNGFTLVRFTRGGSLDHSFGRGGIVRPPASGGSQDSVVSLAIDPQGRIVVEGISNIARYEPNGKLDVTFGQNGSTAISFWGEAMSLNLQGDIVAAGATADGRVAIVHLLSNGQLDFQFGAAGLVSTSPISPSQSLTPLLIQPDGGVLLRTSISNQGYLLRFTPMGQIDLAFADGGALQIMTFGSMNDASTSDLLGMQSDGKIILVVDFGRSVLRLK